MKLNYNLLILLLGLIIPLNAQDVFKLILLMDKSVFIKGEPVEVGVSIVNLSKNTIEEKHLGAIQLKLIDGNGNEVQRNGIAGEFSGPLKQKLLPEEEDYFIIQLNDYLGYRSSGFAIFFQYFTLGNYTLQASFHPQNTFYNEVTSQVLFQVIEPESEDLITYNKLQEILKQESRNPLDKQNIALTANALRTLYETYPNSAYSLHILEMLDAMYYIPLREYDNVNWTQTELVEKCSWSIHVVGICESILKNIANDSEKTEFINELAVKNKSRIIEKYYLQKLINVE